MPPIPKKLTIKCYRCKKWPCECVDGITLICGDNRDVVKELSGVTAVVTDPPYGLEFMGKDWDCGVPGEHFWAGIAKCCLPGAHMLAFGGTRTYHRLACAIEDAGWEIRDCLQWIYGSGFPKSLDVSKKLDSDSAQLWSGYGTSLKPAYEPILLARKPLSGTVAANCLEHGCGGLNVDGCRIDYLSDADRSSATPQGACTAKPGALAGKSQHDGERTVFSRPEQLGRFPANVIHDGSEEVLAMFPGEGDQSAARFFYGAKASRSERTAGGKVENKHPTVKPLALMRYLLTLLKMPERNLFLDPFAGSGSTLVAAKQLKVPCIGIELSEEYCEIIAKRLAG